jgi:hypothetical protein
MTGKRAERDSEADAVLLAAYRARKASLGSRLLPFLAG